jgi:F-type H+-transporting ATPase subunit c
MLFSGLVGLTVSVLLPAIALAAEGAPQDNDFSVKMYLALASGFGIALAAFGGALAQGKAASAALEGIARNPGASGKILTPMILALALIESLVIYALIIAFVLSGKIG